MATVTTTATTTLLQTITRTVSAGAATSSAFRATPQGGILEHVNPVVYDNKNPITLFIIQAGIIIIFCRLLHYPLSLIRQPRVIAEVIGGILLGPSVFGRIPNFTNTIFPTAAMPNLSLVANLGLVLFLFIVGLEVDLRFLVSNWKVAANVGLAGMILPFGLGCGLAWGLYKDFPAQIPISFPVFMLFVGVAMAITAFPVLCRILTELKLLGTNVGIITLSAGVANDVVGWILLALCVTLVNAGTGLTALWVLLTCVGYTLFLVYVIRPVFIIILRRTRSIEDGPSQGIVALTLLITLASAFFTNVIGVHAIFGAFMVGLICPHEGGFAIKIVEKVEDLIGAIFLPLYFALSGLSTNLGLLNSGLVWGYVIGIIAVAFVGKFVGASFAARASGLVWRESFTIGTLMSCKGLVELIVLNIGLQARILTVQTFTMFVVMALVTTFATTPLTVSLYPPWYQKKIEQWKRGEIEWDTGAPTKSSRSDTSVSRASSVDLERFEHIRVRKLLVYLRLDNMPSILAFINLLSGPQAYEARIHPSKVTPVIDGAAGESEARPSRRINAHGVRLISLTERPSSVMQVAEVEEAALQDPVVNTFRSLGQLYNVPASGEVDVVPEDLFADTLANRASDYSSDLLFLPWSESNTLSEVASLHKPLGIADGSYSRFALSALQAATCNTALFCSHSTGQAPQERPGVRRSRSIQSVRSMSGVRDLPRPSIIRNSIRHIFCPLLGGPDDLLALRLTMQMVEKGATATIVRFSLLSDSTSDDELDEIALAKSTSGINAEKPRLDHRSASAAFTKATPLTPLPTTRDAALFESLRTSLPADTLDRVAFEFADISAPHAPGIVCATVLARAAADIDVLPKTLNSLVVVGHNWGLRGLHAGSAAAATAATAAATAAVAPASSGVVGTSGGMSSLEQTATQTQTQTQVQTESERCLGVLGMAFVASSLKGGFVVVKAAESS